MINLLLAFQSFWKSKQKSFFNQIHNVLILHFILKFYQIFTHNIFLIFCSFKWIGYYEYHLSTRVAHFACNNYLKKLSKINRLYLKLLEMICCKTIIQFFKLCKWCQHLRQILIIEVLFNQNGYSSNRDFRNHKDKHFELSSTETAI